MESVSKIVGVVESRTFRFLSYVEHLFLPSSRGYWWLDTQLRPSVDAMSWALKQGNIGHSYKRFAGGRHNERAWSLRIHEPILHLFGKS